MIEKAIRKHINIYRESYPNSSLDEFIAAVLGELEIEVTEENFGDLLIEGMEEAVKDKKEEE